MAALSEEYIETDVGKVQLFRGGDGPPLVYLHSAAGEARTPAPRHHGASNPICASAAGPKPSALP